MAIFFDFMDENDGNLILLIGFDVSGWARNLIFGGKI